MDAVWIALIAFLIFTGVLLLGGGVLFLFFRFRDRQSVHIPMRLLLRLYLYVVIVVGALLFTQGTAPAYPGGFRPRR